MDKELIPILISVAIIAIGAYMLGALNCNESYFSQVPDKDIHTMRVYEDGSFEIIYKDKGLGQTSEIGCLPEGFCND